MKMRMMSRFGNSRERLYSSIYMGVVGCIMIFWLSTQVFYQFPLGVHQLRSLPFITTSTIMR